MSEIIIVELKNLSRDLQERGLLVSSETVDKAIERLAAAEAREGQLRDGFKLCIGMTRNVPWMDVPDYDVDGYVARVEQLNKAAKGGRDE